MKVASLRIGLIGPLPPPSGGMANQTRQLARLLSEENIKVSVVQVNSPYRPAWVHKLRGLRALFRLYFYFLSLWRVAGQVDLFHIMANSGWSWHLFTAPAIIVARLRGVVVVVNYRGGGAGEFFSRSFRWVNLSLKHASAVVVPSGFLEKVFVGYGVQPRIVPNIIDVEKFLLKCHEIKLDDGNPPVIFVARNLEVIYGIDVLIQAFKKVSAVYPDAKLIIAGIGPEHSALLALAKQLEVEEKITFTGRIDNDQMVEIYQRTSVAVNPSRVDNMPISILEALACGVPVVSTNAGGIPYMVENGETALLVPVDDVDKMADAITKVLSEHDVREKLIRQGRDSINTYTWPHVKKKLFSVYESVLDEKLNNFTDAEKGV